MDKGEERSIPRVMEKLDVESEEVRQARIQSFLERLNSSSSSPQSFTAKQPPGIPKFDFDDRTTFFVDSPSELLSRVQAFLPQMEASNSLLSQRMQEDPNSLDIEHISDGMDQYIEMNLGLGLFEDRSKRTEQQNEDSEMSTSSSSESSDSSEKTREGDEDEADSDADSDSSSVIITLSPFAPSRPVKPLPRRATNPRPQIVVIGEENFES